MNRIKDATRLVDWIMALTFLALTCFAGACWVLRAEAQSMPPYVQTLEGKLSLVDWSKVSLLAMTVGQDESKPGPLCGTEPTHPHADLVHIGCVDYEELRRVAPQIAWPRGTSTQVLIHAKRGDFVAVTLDGETKYWPLTRDAWGRLVALVTFEGNGHKDLSIKFGAWLE